VCLWRAPVGEGRLPQRVSDDNEIDLLLGTLATSAKCAKSRPCSLSQAADVDTIPASSPSAGCMALRSLKDNGLPLLPCRPLQLTNYGHIYTPRTS
jgi:hypothetical protein